MSPVLIVMGVSGVGKSTIAAALNTHLGWPFKEGDELHPAANVAKMHAGIPLTDADRAPWLGLVHDWIAAQVAAGAPGMITCSALRRVYRDRIVDGQEQVRLLYLKADPAILRARLEQRTRHFMPASLLDSQLQTLEEPAPEERPIVVAVDGSLQETVALAWAALLAAFGPGLHDRQPAAWPA